MGFKQITFGRGSRHLNKTMVCQGVVVFKQITSFWQGGQGI